MISALPNAFLQESSKVVAGNKFAEMPRQSRDVRENKWVSWVN